MTTDNKSLETEQVKDLYKAIAQLNTATEVQKFMRDLCSRAELETMAERWDIVRYVQEGIPYRKIAEQTGASTATITRVAQWLHHGMGGYELMLNRSSRGGLSKATDIIATHLKAQKAIDTAKKTSQRTLAHRQKAKKSTKAVA